MRAVQYDERVEEWLNNIPVDIKAKVVRIVDMLVLYGPFNVKEPYVKHVSGYKKLFEIRAKGKDGIARVFYFTASEERIIILHGFIKKTMKTPKRELCIAVKRMQEVLNG
ncbi:MAG: type II toxin-antitoxin system RelE/ParE family toxin [Nitrospirae bacterium]|nr:MAG: type II toxin-antitoxin system RelE/ParE family toxin [Nitrospirota bacterium]